MPAYRYEIIDERSGGVLQEATIVCPVDLRDRVVLRRVTVPDRVTVAGSAENPHDAKKSNLKAYHAQECKHGSRFKSRFTKDQIKKAWQE
jgi:hypothetical protein